MTTTRSRRNISYDQFTKPRRKRKRWPWLVLGFVILGGAGAVGAFFYSSQAQAAHHAPPPALSTAGGPVADETYQWSHVAIGGGGFITGLAFDAGGNTMVARTDVYGAYIWSPQADRWVQLMTASAMPAADRVQGTQASGVYEIAVAPSRPDRIFMAAKGHVYRTDDRGAHWVGSSTIFPEVWDANSAFRTNGPFLTVSPTNADLVFLGTSSGLWRSTNGGESWQRVSSVPASEDRDKATPGLQAPGTQIWFERGEGGKPSGRIFALASGHGMYVSQDGGASFNTLPSVGAQPMTLRRGTFDRHGAFLGVDDVGKGVWLYRDGRWHDLTHEAGLPMLPWTAAASNPQADQLVIFDQSGDGYQSTDGGKSWNHVSHSAKVGAGDPPWLKVSDASYFSTGDVQFDPKVANRLWVGGGTGPFYADFPPGTSAVEWVSQARGIEELVTNDAIQAPGQSPIFAGWDFGLHVKDDLNAFSTTFGPNERGLMSVQQMDWSPADPKFVVSNASDARHCCSEDGNAVMAGTSTDGGRTWTKFASLPTPPGEKDDDPWRMSYGAIAVSSGNIDNIVWEPSDNRTPFYTMDRGRTWSPVRLPGEVGPKTGSFPHMWQQRKTLTADKTEGGVFYLYHSGEAPNIGLQGLWRSRDGGASWSRVFAGEIAPSSGETAKLRSVPGHAGHLFFTSAVAGGADTGLRRSSDGGASWQVVAHVDHVDDVAFGKAAKGKSYPTIFISGRVDGRYGLWRSVDNAGSWQQVADFPAGNLDQVTAIAADPDVFGRVYIGYVGSSWVWGEPAPCKTAKLPAGKSCFKVN
ncbi:hypothetical protein [Novosphingobium terrae]|uniref:hypothetical protein n=1 Tax=Novosphingobium terrae TaxID=2726189 RepID=UPI00197F023C|nr:hypothetical protein [Novosphingobium terrae]